MSKEIKKIMPKKAVVSTPKKPMGMRAMPFEDEYIPPTNESKNIRIDKEVESNAKGLLADIFSDEYKLEVDIEAEDIALPPPPPLLGFPSRLQNIIDSVAVAKSVPPQMVMGMLLALGSACIGRARGLHVEQNNGWSEFANLYFLVIAETGVGKSHTFDFIFKHLNHLEALQKAKWKVEQKKYEEDMAQWRKKKSSDDSAPVKPTNIQYLLDDSTIEAAVERLEDNPRGLFWAVDEFSGFFEGLDRYSKNGAGEGKNKLLSAYDSKKISVTRKSKDGQANETYIAKATFGLYGNIQPFLVKSLFTMNDVKQGWPHRFLYIRARATASGELPAPEISHEVHEDLKRITDKLIDLKMNETEKGLETKFLTMDSEAQNLFYFFVNNLNDKAGYGREKEYIVKMYGMTVRLALIIHLMSWAVGEEYTCSNEIGFDSMQLAIDLAAYFLANAEYVRNYLPDHTKVARTVKNTNVWFEETRKSLAKAVYSMPDEDRKAFTQDEIIEYFNIDFESGGGKGVLGKVLTSLGINRKQERRDGVTAGVYFTDKTDEIIQVVKNE